MTFPCPLSVLPTLNLSEVRSSSFPFHERFSIRDFVFRYFEKFKREENKYIERDRREIQTKQTDISPRKKISELPLSLRTKGSKGKRERWFWKVNKKELECEEIKEWSYWKTHKHFTQNLYNSSSSSWRIQFLRREWKRYCLTTKQRRRKWSPSIEVLEDISETHNLNSSMSPSQDGLRTVYTQRGSEYEEDKWTCTWRGRRKKTKSKDHSLPISPADYRLERQWYIIARKDKDKEHSLNRTKNSRDMSLREEWSNTSLSLLLFLFCHPFFHHLLLNHSFFIC